MPVERNAYMQLCLWLSTEESPRIASYRTVVDTDETYRRNSYQIAKMQRDAPNQGYVRFTLYYK